MKQVVALCGLLALSACSSGFTVAADNRMGVYFTDGTADGIPATFLVDTGATSLNFPLGAAQELGVHPVIMDARAAVADGASIAVYSATIPTITVGNCTLRDVPATFTDQANDFVLFGETAIKRINLAVSDGVMTIYCKGP